ncbi:hypothetical protein [Sphingosinicella sp. BN140058]|uniref:hypothetical protein n=1 Tax=Sphingosinicella sp. BN140058 TaxID=1892855 RepID=UPI0010117E87|nr:hypothetical protein [Sphingosinicella sp. BN140058]QAY76029.1 hypothetical protein ETR14_05425 [Sphingosinicella sp. BN140058]
MPRDDRPYYLARAEWELTRARASEHPDAARAHALLAGYYFDRVFGDPPADGDAGQPGAAE